MNASVPSFRSLVKIVVNVALQRYVSRSQSTQAGDWVVVEEEHKKRLRSSHDESSVQCRNGRHLEVGLAMAKMCGWVQFDLAAMLLNLFTYPRQQEVHSVKMNITKWKGNVISFSFSF